MPQSDDGMTGTGNDGGGMRASGYYAFPPAMETAAAPLLEDHAFGLVIVTSRVSRETCAFRRTEAPTRS